MLDCAAFGKKPNLNANACALLDLLAFEDTLQSTVQDAQRAMRGTFAYTAAQSLLQHYTLESRLESYCL